MKKQRILITGGNKGIGLELTKLLANEVNEVIVVARDFSEMDPSIICKRMQFDLTQVDQISSLVQEIGGIDVNVRVHPR